MTRDIRLLWRPDTNSLRLWIELTMTEREPHPYIAIIESYYSGCNTADVERMMATFTDDVVHYFVDHAPVSTAAGLADYWAKVGPRTHANWSVDHWLVQEPEAVIEWSMAWQPPGAASMEILRGSEWFRFRNGRIAEIRSYHNNVHLQSPDNRELHGFDYVGRGYRS